MSKTIYGQEITSFQFGWIEGYWDAERLKASGWNSAQQVLNQMEQNYQLLMEEANCLPDQAAREQRELLTGEIAAERLTLRALIEEGY